MGLGFLNPGCNCELKFEATAACAGILTWCTSAGRALVQRKAVSGSTWETMATVEAGDPKVYTVDHTQSGRIYRVVCEVCPGQGVLSNEVTVQLCSVHSAWYRLHRYNWDLSSVTAEGAEVISGPAIQDLKTGVVWSNPGPNPPPSALSGFTGAVWSASWGCSRPTTPNSSGSATAIFFSWEESGGNAREGFDFDYRYQISTSLPPTCGYEFSMQNILPRGLHVLGNVTYRLTGSYSATQIATRTFDWSVDSSGNLNSFTNWGTFTPSSGLSYSWSYVEEDSADISLWLPPFNSTLWPDGSSSPSLPLDPTGNTVGILVGNVDYSWAPSGTRLECNIFGNPFFYPSASATRFSSSRLVRTATPTQSRIRTCSQAAAGTNTLPPDIITVNGSEWIP
jgi:hypothetical protein